MEARTELPPFVAEMQKEDGLAGQLLHQHIMGNVLTNMKKRLAQRDMPESIADEVGEKWDNLMGDDCYKDEGVQFRKEQLELFRRDDISIDKYEKLAGRKFSSQEKKLYLSSKNWCSFL